MYRDNRMIVSLTVMSVYTVCDILSKVTLYLVVQFVHVYRFIVLQKAMFL